ncbi:hypothetical protein ERO13_D09G173650v2 [Gossypium hirsutum]|nr:hypothetical protein ERO13_D09G173650v2 [Gossypium hirsutum]
MTIATNIKTSLPQIDLALEFLKYKEESFKNAHKSLVDTLMAKLTSTKYDSQKGIQQHIMGKNENDAKFKVLGMNVNNSFLVHFIFNSLPQFAPFKNNYNTRNGISMS